MIVGALQPDVTYQKLKVNKNSKLPIELSNYLSFKPILFVVSEIYTKTIKDFGKKNTYNWEQIQMFNGKPKLVFTGEGLQSISFNMQLLTALMSNPTAAVEEIISYAKEGIPFIFYLGTDTSNVKKYVITNLDDIDKRFSMIGTSIVKEVRIEMLEYN